MCDKNPPRHCIDTEIPENKRDQLDQMQDNALWVSFDSRSMHTHVYTQLIIFNTGKDHVLLYKIDLRQINSRLANGCFRIHSENYTIPITDKSQ